MISSKNYKLITIPFILLIFIALHLSCSDKTNPMLPKIEESENNAKGTILQSESIWAKEEKQDSTKLYNLSIKSENDSLVSCYSNNSTYLKVNDSNLEITYHYKPNDIIPTDNNFCTLADLINKVNRDYSKSFLAELDDQGAILMTDQIGKSHQLAFQSNNPIFKFAFNSANGIVDSSLGITVKSSNFSHPVEKNDKLANLQNKYCENVNLQNGDIINISAKVGSSNVTDVFSIVKFSTLSDLTESIKSTLNIKNITGLSIGSSGKIIITGDPGKENEISNLAIREAGNQILNSIMDFEEIEPAQN
jgi:hypothetical protein